MELHEIKQRIAVVRDRCKPGDFARRSLTEAIEMLEGLEEVDEPPVSVDDGFAILPMPRYEALRQAEEHLQETRFAPIPPVDGVSRTWYEAFEAERAKVRAMKEEIGRFKEAEVAAPLAPEAPRAADEVLLKHIQDHQAEIEGIKERLDEGCGQFNGISAAIGNLRDGAKVARNELCNLGDRINALGARLNKLDAREVART